MRKKKPFVAFGQAIETLLHEEKLVRVFSSAEGTTITAAVLDDSQQEVAAFTKGEK